MVPGIPTALIPRFASFCAPAKEPSPPITTRPSIPCFLQISAAFFCPSSVLISAQRAVYRIVPPRPMISDTSFAVISMISSFSNPSYPFRIPFIFSPLLSPRRTTARIAAFIPGASPPLVNTPMVLSSFAIMFPPLIYLI